MAWHGAVWWGRVRRGEAGHGMAWYGRVWPGEAGLGGERRPSLLSSAFYLSWQTTTNDRSSVLPAAVEILFTTAYRLPAVPPDSQIVALVVV